MAAQGRECRADNYKMFLLKPTYRNYFDRCGGSQLCDAVEQLGAVWNGEGGED